MRTNSYPFKLFRCQRCGKDLPLAEDGTLLRHVDNDDHTICRNKMNMKLVYDPREM